MKITQNKLKEILDYNPKTGIFIWKVSFANNINKGEIAGCVNGNGYIQISIKGKLYLAHRLAFLYMKGYFPEFDVDHKKGIKTDNRWKNIRHATKSCNLQNQKMDLRNKSGFPGVFWCKRNKKWKAQIGINKKTISLGYYESSLEAALARFTAEVWDDEWTCNYRSELVKAIKKEWSGFKTSTSSIIV